MIKAITFDLDYTLYDRNATYLNMIDSFCSTFEANISKSMSKNELALILQTGDRDGIYNGGWRGIYQKVCEYKLFDSLPGFDVFYQFILNSFPVFIKAYDDTYEILTWCRNNGYMPSIITNGPEEYQMSKIKALNLERYVDSIVVGGAIGYHKPAPQIFHTMSEKLSVPLSQIAHVGDDPINDVDGARRVGMTPIWFRSNGIWPENLEAASFYIDTLSELPKIITRLHEAN